jgi:hypothetical protein
MPSSAVTTNIQIDRWAKRQGIRGWLGVFSHDTLPPSLSKTRYQCLVMNLADRAAPGTHWVCIVNDPRQQSCVEYYDPFGLPPDARTVRCMKTCGRPIRYNSSQLQSLSSEACGHFCMRIIERRSSGNSMYDTIYDLFTPLPSRHNERVVRSR